GHQKLETADLLASRSRAIGIAVIREVVLHGPFGIADAGLKQRDHALLARVLEHFQAGNADSRGGLSDIELRSGKDIAGRDVEHVVARVAGVRAVFGVSLVIASALYPMLQHVTVLLRLYHHLIEMSGARGPVIVGTHGLVVRGSAQPLPCAASYGIVSF